MCDRVRTVPHSVAPRFSMRNAESKQAADALDDVVVLHLPQQTNLPEGSAVVGAQRAVRMSAPAQELRH